MKNFRLIILFAAAVALLAGCDKHDKLDDLVYVGKMAPQLQWTVTSTTINAGNSVPFTARYYTTAKTPISHLEVWYNITEVENKSVSAPFVSSFSYTIASEKTVERRINQKISEYPHDESRWNDKERSYNFEESFPTSSTLSKVSFGADKLYENYVALIGAIIKAKPAAAKGQYIKSCVTASTMGPGVKINAQKQL